MRLIINIVRKPNETLCKVKIFEQQKYQLRVKIMKIGDVVPVRNIINVNEFL